MDAALLVDLVEEGVDAVHGELAVDVDRAGEGSEGADLDLVFVTPGTSAPTAGHATPATIAIPTANAQLLTTMFIAFLLMRAVARIIPQEPGAAARHS